jgi:hypothetical protein
VRVDSVRLSWEGRGAGCHRVRVITPTLAETQWIYISGEAATQNAVEAVGSVTLPAQAEAGGERKARKRARKKTQGELDGEAKNKLHLSALFAKQRNDEVWGRMVEAVRNVFRKHFAHGLKHMKTLEGASEWRAREVCDWTWILGDFAALLSDRSLLGRLGFTLDNVDPSIPEGWEEERYNAKAFWDLDVTAMSIRAWSMSQRAQVMPNAFVGGMHPNQDTARHGLITSNMYALPLIG